MANTPTLHRQANGRFAPGHSGNPKGPKPGTRRALSEDFVSDVYEAWKAFGKSALVATAWNEPSVFVRVVAGLMPKDVEVTVTKVNAERMSSAELRALIREHRPVGADPLETNQDPDGVFRVG